jgi:AcrR family transcriptional regulator
MPHLSLATRQSILTAALKLFAERTYDSVKMDDVAKEAKIGKPTVYRYFDDKEDLYFKMLEQIGTDFLELLRKADESAQKCRQRLVAIVEVALQYFTERKYLLKLLDRASIDRAADKKFPWLEVQRQLFLMLQGLLAKGIVRGEFAVDDIELAMLALIGAMRYQLLYPCKEMDAKEIPERLIGMLVREPGSAPVKKSA